MIATAGSDYTSGTMDLTFTGGSSMGAMMCLNVLIDDDNMAEGDEMFTVMLTLTSTGVELGRTAIIINDNEGSNGHICINVQ